ncbi:MAG: hypothetical protein RLZZ58_968 [Pseudomonadota bacterium]
MTRRASFPRPALQAALLAMLLPGCARGGGSDFPSLARRPVEGVMTAVQTEPAAAAATVPAGAPLQEKLTAWGAASIGADRAFQAALPDVEARVAAASSAPSGSDDWFAAHQALARLDVLRGPLSRIWGDVDALFVDRTVAGDPEGADALAALHAQLAVTAAAQIAAVERLAARIAPR